MLEDYSQQQPIATWNPVRGVWETSQVNLLCGHSELWSDPWPQSGIAVNGQVFELRMQEHRTADSEFSSSLILRTPTASQGEGGALGEEEARKRGNTVGIRDQTMDIARANGQKVSREQLNVLPTPISSDAKGTGPADANRETTQLRAINILLPTVTTQESHSGPSQQNRNTVPLNALAVYEIETDWGKFEPAIRRWEEVLGRPAPAPTKPDGKDGAHRLSSDFTEWMMGLELGWITSCGLSRNQELKACGNGVVPQQAEMALRMLLDGMMLDLTNVTDK